MKKNELLSSLSAMKTAYYELLKDVAEQKTASEGREITIAQVDNLENFKQFLKENGIGTKNDEEVFKLVSTNKSKKYTSSSFDMRKMHIHRDNLIKKFFVPFILTAGASFGIMSAVATSGTSVAFVPIMSTVGKTILANAFVALPVGAVVTAGYLATKALITRAHYNKYGSAKSNLRDLNRGTKLEDLKINTLMQTIVQTNEQIMNLRDGAYNIFSRTARAIKRMNLNIVNRNRTHHIEKYTKQIVSLLNSHSVDTSSKLQLKSMLAQVGQFIDKDLTNSKFAMLTTRTYSPRLNSMFENLDIYAKMENYLRETKNGDTKSAIRNANANAKNTARLRTIATDLLNGRSSFEGITYTPSNYIVKEEIKKPTHDDDAQITPSHTTDDETELTFANDYEDDTVQAEYVPNHRPVGDMSTIKPVDLTPVTPATSEQPEEWDLPDDDDFIDIIEPPKTEEKPVAEETPIAEETPAEETPVAEMAPLAKEIFPEDVNAEEETISQNNTTPTDEIDETNDAPIAESKSLLAKMLDTKIVIKKKLGRGKYNAGELLGYKITVTYPDRSKRVYNITGDTEITPKMVEAITGKSSFKDSEIEIDNVTTDDVAIEQ